MTTTLEQRMQATWRLFRHSWDGRSVNVPLVASIGPYKLPRANQLEGPAPVAMSVRRIAGTLGGRAAYRLIGTTGDTTVVLEEGFSLMALHNTYGVSQARWDALKEWRRDCGDYVVDDETPIIVENDVHLWGHHFYSGVYHKTIPLGRAEALDRQVSAYRTSLDPAKPAPRKGRMIGWPGAHLGMTASRR